MRILEIIFRMVSIIILNGLGVLFFASLTDINYDAPYAKLIMCFCVALGIVLLTMGIFGTIIEVKNFLAYCKDKKN